MPKRDRRAEARRRAWGRGPAVLRFEPLEGRQLLATSVAPQPDLVATSFSTVHTLDWGDTFRAVGTIRNQGEAPVVAPYAIDVYASPTPSAATASVYLGSIPMQAGLAAGGSASFDSSFVLPTGPIPGFDALSQNFYITLNIDPTNLVGDVQRLNNFGQGLGLDASLVTITVDSQASLYGSSFGVGPDRTTWGQPITVYGKVTNYGQGAAPATRATITLTPTGQATGGPTDVTLASVPIPALAASQTADFAQTITLPAAPTAALAGTTLYTLSLVTDADYQTNQLALRYATQGYGLDAAQVVIGPSATSGAAKGPLPNLTVAGVSAPTLSQVWGQPIQVLASMANTGAADAGPFKVRFLLSDPNNASSPSIYLGDATVNGLRAGFGQNLVQTVKLPIRLPNGALPQGVTPASIRVVIDPENNLEESNEVDNATTSASFKLRLFGTPANDPAPAATTTPKTNQPAATPKANAAKKTAKPKVQPGAAQPAGTVKKIKTTKPALTPAQRLKIYRDSHPNTQ